MCSQVVSWLQMFIVASWIVNAFLAACVVVLVILLRSEMEKTRPIEKLPAKIAALPSPRPWWRRRMTWDEWPGDPRRQ